MSTGCSFFFNDTATTEIYTLSLHDALPISIMFTLSVRSFQTPPTPLTCAWPPSLPSEPTSRATRVTSPAKDRKSTRLNSSHANISYAVFCLKKKKGDRSVIESHRHHAYRTL